MYLALLGLPIFGSIFSGFFGRKIGVSGSQLVTCTCILITTLLAINSLIEVGINNNTMKTLLFRWMDAEYLNVYWAFNFDSLTVSMLIPVLIISSLVHIYSIGYMSHDPHNQRFFSYLSLFTFMMIVLVTGNNFLVMFVGWEGVGVCSYLLVSFWFTRIAANQSSLAAFFTNRVGDYVLTVGMFAILWSFGNLDYMTVFSLSPFFSESIILFIGICLLIGAMAKSSQIGLHVWLPMAMEGPTPVSALIHAATMVTAGVYLLMRTSPLIEFNSGVLFICLWVGAITTVFSSLIGLFQQDIKKVIAYSTMSQLGMMVIAIGLSCYTIALFHLINHAFYKGLLFLCAGAVIHAVADNQDFRKYGGLVSYLPLTYSLMLAASLSLVAFPFMTGFYSKDLILEAAYGKYNLSSITVYFIATIGAMFTTLYSVKVLYLTFLTNPNGSLINYTPNKSAHEGDLFMSAPLIILAVFSIFFGYVMKDIYIGLGSSFFSDNALYIHPNHEIFLDTEFGVSTFYKLLPLFFTVSLTVVSIYFTEFKSFLLVKFKQSNIGRDIFSFLNQRFLVEMFYNVYISGVVLELGGQTTRFLDKGAVECIGPYGLEKLFTNLSEKFNNLSTGVVTNYALYIVIGLILYINIRVLDTTTIFILIGSFIVLAIYPSLPFITSIVKNNLQSTFFGDEDLSEHTEDKGKNVEISDTEDKGKNVEVSGTDDLSDKPNTLKRSWVKTEEDDLKEAIKRSRKGYFPYDSVAGPSNPAPERVQYSSSEYGTDESAITTSSMEKPKLMSRAEREYRREILDREPHEYNGPGLQRELERNKRKRRDQMEDIYEKIWALKGQLDLKKFWNDIIIKFSGEQKKEAADMGNKMLDEVTDLKNDRDNEEDSKLSMEKHVRVLKYVKESNDKFQEKLNDAGIDYQIPDKIKLDQKNKWLALFKQKSDENDNILREDQEFKAKWSNKAGGSEAGPSNIGGSETVPSNISKSEAVPSNIGGSNVVTDRVTTSVTGAVTPPVQPSNSGSPVDYVLEKQAEEMDPIFGSDDE